MTSTSGLVGNLGQANYSAAKLGIVGLSKSIALDMAKYNVRSNCISPFAWSRMIGSIPTETDEQKARVEKLKSMETAKIAPLAVYLGERRRERCHRPDLCGARQRDLPHVAEPPAALGAPRRRLDARDDRRARDSGAAAALLRARALAGRVLVGPAVKRVLLSDSIAAAGEELLASAATVIRAPDSAPATLKRLAGDVDGIITRSKLPEDLFAAAPRVRGVVVHGAGTDLVPVESATAHGVMVANLPGINAQSAAEYCAMAMLMLARRIVPITESLRKSSWDEARRLGANARELTGMTLGIVGVGAIGGRLAKIARHGFGMKVLGHQRRLDRLPPEAQPSGLPEMLAVSDFVVLACPLTPQTKHLVNAKTLGLMKPAAWLINVGRGPVVQEEALIDALRAGRIAGAMLDVYEHYRLEPGHPLFSLDNVILTPHLAAVTQEARARAGVAAADEMLRILRGERPRNLVNPEVLKRELT